MTRVKVCGVTRVEDALVAADLGAYAIGLNFVEASPRRIDPTRAHAIAQAIHGAKGASVLVVGVVADLDLEAMRTLVSEVGLDRLQLHGEESPGILAALLPNAYKAIRVGTAEDVARAEAFGGDQILVDARVEGTLGGTGMTFDWGLVRALAGSRRLTLAGGLTTANVVRAIREVRPWAVDVASGVEAAPGMKDQAKLRAFIEAARGA